METPDQDLFKRQAHLIGEAFPNDFTITFIIARNDDGTLKKTCSVIAAPKTQQEFNALKGFLSAINPHAE